MSVKILEIIQLHMSNLGLHSRAKLADKMNTYSDRGCEWSKEKLDKVFNGGHCPRPDTLAEMKRAVGIADFPPAVYRSKIVASEED